MMRQAKPAFLALVWLSLLTGLAYPLAMTGIAQLLFPAQANGSLLAKADGSVAGSALIGQPIDDPKYFWSRLSATGPMAYNGAVSSGSNYGPLNEALTDAVKARIAALRAAQIDALGAAHPGNTTPVPVDLATASSSGLDPHISVAAAEYQTARVARVRAMSEADVRALVAAHTRGRQLGFLGEPVVEMLALNLALDARTAR